MRNFHLIEKDVDLVIKDVTGCRFGMLIALERTGSDKKGESFWKCKCDCGNEKVVRLCNLTSGLTRSCGCLHDKGNNLKHGHRNTRLYNIWRSMKQRCYNPSTNRYHCYGKLGIAVCDSWKNDFVNFYSWATSNGYQDDLSIDRINVDGNYEPSNCRWADAVTQANNRRPARRRL